MRMLATTLVFCLAFFLAFPQSKKEMREQKNQKDFEIIKQLIDGEMFQFEAEYVNPQHGGTISLTSAPNMLIIRNDSVFCDLPFFGVAYHVDYGERGGFHFEEPIANWDVRVKDKRMQEIITFEAKKVNDWYKCILTVSPGGSATLFISSQNRSTISYWGKLQPIEKKDDKK